VLLEGLHCTGILSQIGIGERKIVVRLHNEESIYYKELCACRAFLAQEDLLFTRKQANRKIHNGNCRAVAVMFVFPIQMQK